MIRLEKKLYKILSQVLNVPIEQINSESSPDTISEWDSLKHMNLVLTIEQEFGIQFTEEQIIEMLNVALIVETLKEHQIDI